MSVLEDKDAIHIGQYGIEEQPLKSVAGHEPDGRRE